MLLGVTMVFFHVIDVVVDMAVVVLVVVGVTVFI